MEQQHPHDVPGDPEVIPTISFRALERARSTIEDFVSSYFVYHDLQIPSDFFRFLDVLIFVEATIYHMDEVNEGLTQGGERDATQTLPGERELLDVLRQRGLLDEHIQHELQQGKEYWRLERGICSEMKARGAAATAGQPPRFSLEDVLCAHEAKSFDYRVLNLLLYRLTGRPQDPTVLRFLKVDEMLVDIGDDLVDYEEDVEKNAFNIYRGYLHLFGKDAQLQLVTRISDLEQEHSQLLTQLPLKLQQHYWKRHNEASSIPGSEKWVFPPVFMAEEGYM